MNISNDLTLEDKKTKRTGKEIVISGNNFNNSDLKFKVGAVFDKQNPETIYIETGFWIDIKERQFPTEDDKYSFFDYNKEISKKLSTYIRNLYRIDLKDFLKNNEMFPRYLENIFVYDYPDNINYNKKRSFVSIELSLHTINSDEKNQNKYPLNDKKETKLLDEAIKVCKIISDSDLLKGKKEFTIHRKKK
jgi:hypothetical protein